MPQLPDNKFGIIGELVDFSQSQYEIYQPAWLTAARDNYFDFGGGAGFSADAVVKGAVCRAAIMAGFLKGITEKQIGELKPAAVAWLAEVIRKHVDSVLNPPPDPL
jgi:hypothetical protein